VYCREEIHAAASVCPHCRSNLVPLQRLSDERAALEERVAVLEQSVAALRLAHPADAESGSSAIVAGVEAVPPLASGIGWPHMVDNIFLGLVALVAAHWLATTLPTGSRTLFRLVALIVALPFGYRFERNSRSGAVAQVIAALGYGSFGTVALGLLDMAVGSLTPQSLSAPDITSTLAAIALSHFAGSALAQARQARADRAASAVAARRSGLLPHLEAAGIKRTAETVKALYEAITPVAAGAAAVWAACNHILF
jgi:uncharacterized membrane protein YeaQ/YmgE (transglycosylase-associated protein family)